jgi:hypothetical protein
VFNAKALPPVNTPMGGRSDASSSPWHEKYFFGAGMALMQLSSLRA